MNETTTVVRSGAELSMDDPRIVWPIVYARDLAGGPASSPAPRGRDVMIGDSGRRDFWDKGAYDVTLRAAPAARPEPVRKLAAGWKRATEHEGWSRCDVGGPSGRGHPGFDYVRQMATRGVLAVCEAHAEGAGVFEVLVMENVIVDPGLQTATRQEHPGCCSVDGCDRPRVAGVVGNVIGLCLFHAENGTGADREKEPYTVGIAPPPYSRCILCGKSEPCSCTGTGSRPWPRPWKKPYSAGGLYPQADMLERERTANQWQDLTQFGRAELIDGERPEPRRLPKVAARYMPNDDPWLDLEDA